MIKISYILSLMVASYFPSDIGEIECGHDLGHEVVATMVMPDRLTFPYVAVLTANILSQWSLFSYQGIAAYQVIEISVGHPSERRPGPLIIAVKRTIKLSESIRCPPRRQDS